MALPPLSDWLERLILSPGLQIAASVVAVLLAAWLIRLSNGWAEERPIRYTVPLPKVPEIFKVADETSIKVSGTTAIQCYAPATGQLLGFVNPSTPASIDRAVALAAAAQPAWARTSFPQRRAVLGSLLGHVLAHQRDICAAASLDSGKTAVDAALGEILVTAERIRWTVANGERALRPSRRPAGPILMAHKRGEVRYEPLGVVAALVSWNYPFHNAVAPMISGLFAGNAVVVKVSERTAWSAAYFASIVRGALVVHGHDPNLVQTVVCWPATAAHLTAHPAVSHVTLIGSRPVGQQVAAAAARTLVPLVVELGGKDAAVVLGSAGRDLGRIVEILLRGAFQAAGQNCIGIERVVAEPAVYDRLLAALGRRVRQLRLGPEADVGAMISDDRFDCLEGLVRDAVAGGARLLAGGSRHRHPQHPAGHYFTPTLLADATPDMAIWHSECFAPILLLARVPPGPPGGGGDTAATAAAAILALANVPEFGLGASVFGAESDPILHAVVAGLRVGNVAVNDFGAFYAMQLPFGGVGGSGYGRFGGEEGLRGLCATKSVCWDRWWWLGARTAIPRPVRYPVPDPAEGGRSWAFTRAVIGFGYGLTWGERVRALVEIVVGGAGLAGGVMG